MARAQHFRSDSYVAGEDIPSPVSQSSTAHSFEFEEPERMHPAARILLFVVVAAIGVVLDQLSKAYMRDALAGGKSLTFIDGVIDFVLVQNTGAAFSIGQGMGWIFAVIAAAVCLFALIYVARSKSMGFLGVFFIACVAGGGIGNLIDRVSMGSVTDFIKTSFIDFPVFNVADMLVCVGVFMTLVITLVDEARGSNRSIQEGSERGSN